MTSQRRPGWGVNASLIAITTLSLVACATPRQQATTLYDDLGREEGVEQIVHHLIIEIAGDDVVKPHFRNINIAGFRDRLEDFFCQIADGPCEYHGRSMRDSHATLGIDRKAFNHLVAGLIQAMQTADIDYPSQNALLARLSILEEDIVTGTRVKP